MKKTNNTYEKILFREFKKNYYGLNTVSELEQAKKDYKVISSSFGEFEPTVSKFIELKEKEFKELALNELIKPFEAVEPITFNLKGLSEVENKINRLDSPKLKFEFQGLFNLLNDKSNLVYNDLYTRKKIIKDLNKFKSLKFFKIAYISKYNLKNEYKYLNYKNDCIKGYSKIHFIKNGLYVVKTLNHDDITIKVFYIGNRYKTLLKSSNNVKMVLKKDKFNLSCIDAYKTLNKKDNIRYYSYCNSIGLDKSNRDLLRSIRKSKRLSKDSLIDLLEDRESEIIEKIGISSDLEVLYLEVELQDIKEKLQELKTFEEDNSMEDKTFLSDYF